MLATPVLSGVYAKSLFKWPTNNPKIPLGMDAHSVSGMRWSAQQLIYYSKSKLAHIL